MLRGRYVNRDAEAHDAGVRITARCRWARSIFRRLGQEHACSEAQASLSLSARMPVRR
jgi:hypothetical protein